MTEEPITDGGGDGNRSVQSSRFTYRLDDELPSHAVVQAVAAITNESPLELDPLYDVIDPGRLNGAFAGPSDGTVTTEISFTFEEFDVTVTDEQVRVQETDDTN